MWFDKCMIRYSNKYFFSIMEYEPFLNVTNGENIEEPDVFMNALNETICSLASKVIRRYKKSSVAKYATSVFILQGNPIYKMAQCTPDISKDDCSKCLHKAILHLHERCWGEIGCRILMPNCFVRHERYEFYFSNPKGKWQKNVAIVTSITALVSLLIYLSFKMMKKVKKDTINEKTDCSRFSLSIIEAATNNFSDNNKLGEGGFGTVYREIAAKRLSKSSMQGTEEFMNEVQSVGKIRHRNLVRLLRVCLEGEEKILVYEFVPNKSLDYFLFG
ncbi:cysteine-rich receptor-like protein kinase 25 [Hevea brasiliensis]|uniref:cysteine-rich receptor-like protein kinase 25 n=1 Tax=Hevea brasiliensis TaxID=3981 RepID=UPI0025DBDF74|nr:cysteine-rich receptor-like protein kinase 25 [Hevea brasiliensis]